MSGERLHWVIAGGGTGGHVMPGLALAERLREAGESVLFVGTRRGLETRLVPEAGFELVALDSKPLVGQSLGGRLRALGSLLGCTLAARRELRAFAADLVVSVGGYAAVPVVLAARLCRLPVVLMEPNAVPGFAHRALARFAGLLCIAFPEAAQSLARRKDDPRLRSTGIPLRRSLVEAFREESPRRPAPPFHLFVFGGSQGARQVNDWMLETLPQLDPARIEVVHQTGADDRERVARAYAETRLRAEVVAFEKDMPSRYRWADLVVARSGALSLAEIALAGRPSLLIPLVHAGGGEQLPNARSLEAAGAARVLDPRQASAKDLGLALERLLAEPDELVAMGERARALARPEAAERLIEAARLLVRSRPSRTSRKENS